MEDNEKVIVGNICKDLYERRDVISLETKSILDIVFPKLYIVLKKDDEIAKKISAIISAYDFSKLTLETIGQSLRDLEDNTINSIVELLTGLIFS
ncbi:hypothetical protein RJI07_00635 [Mycoplasmatota bacterium WC30]